MNPGLKTTFLKITIHYAILILLAYLVASLFPGFVEYLPVGAAERLFSYPGELELESSAYSGRLPDGSSLEYGLFFSICFLMSLVLAIPLGTTFLATRRQKKKSASLARMIVILPLVVTGLVLIVQNSLALAFSLAGVVAGSGIRFRTNMQEFTDTLFFLVSIGIGLSAGVGALGVSFLMSLFFCYVFLIAHALGYGEFDPDPQPEAEDS